MTIRQQHRMPDRLNDRSYRYMESALNDLIEDMFAMPPRPGSFDTRFSNKSGDESSVDASERRA